MGAIELQIFVSLVVILGAAFVALICDFLKGNNEQLRESNIEMRVRQHEREKREEILDKVQRHTIETLVQARVAPGPVAAQTPRPVATQQAAPAPTQQIRQAAADAPDTRESFERSQQERSARRREGRRQQPPPVVVDAPMVAEGGQVPAWAQSIVLKKHPHPGVECAPAVVAEAQPVAETAPPVAGAQPIAVRPAAFTSPMVFPEALPVAAQLPMQAALAVSALTRAATSPPQIHTMEPLPLSLVADPAQSVQPVPVELSVSGEVLLPRTGHSLEQPVYELLSPLAVDEPVAAQLPEMDSPVVRIRVLSDSDVLPMGEPLELTLPMGEPEPVRHIESLEPTVSVVAIEPILAAGDIEPALPAVELPMAISAEPRELPSLTSGTESITPVESTEPARSVTVLLPILNAEAVEPSLPVAQIQSLAVAEPRPLTAPNLELRSNVVEMPVAAIARTTESEPPVLADLAIPGGFHEASSLARLLEEESPFNGLAIVISVVDYVGLMADQGKPAAEQLMGSVSRLVVSLAREQDFACRIAEDEFVLLFARETGAAAKRRIQFVSERLWDFQLRSLGSVSVIFSWGASESTKDAVVHAVEHAREQMLESRRNRRALATGIGRFRRAAIS